MMIRWRGWERKSAEYRVVRSFVGWYERRHPVTKPLYLYGPERIYGLYCDTSGYEASVIFLMRPTRPHGLVHTVAHELVHHEQFSRGAKMTERNVNRRAHALVRRWRREAA